MTKSAWHLFSDSGGNFRWELSSHGLPTTPKPSSPPPSLPSYVDALLEGFSLIVEDSGSDSDSHEPSVRRTPIIRSSSTKPKKSAIAKPKASSVLAHDSGVNKSAIAKPKASSVLSDDSSFNKSAIAKPKASFIFADDSSDNVHTGKQCFERNGFNSPNSMFQTGSGKAVNISSAGLLRAKALLGAHDNDDHFTFQGFEPAKKKFSHEDRNAFGKALREVEGNATGAENSALFTKLPFHSGINPSENEIDDMPVGKFVLPEICNLDTKMPPIKFHTAGGRSISVSSEALQRARSLLGDPDIDGFSNEGDTGASTFSFFRNDDSGGNSFDRENKTDSSLSLCQFDRAQQNPQKFVSPLRSSFKRQCLGAKSEVMCSGTNLISKFDAEASICKSNEKPSGLKRPSYEPDKTTQLLASNGLVSGIQRLKRPPGEVLTDITNTLGIDSASKKGTTFELKRLGRRSSVSAFKMPRSSKFATPLNFNVSSAPHTGSLSRASEASYSRERVSTHYPLQPSRPYVNEFFKVPPTHPKMEHLPEQVRLMNPGNSEIYMFYDGSQFIGVEAFYHMLAQSGASMQHASKEWVANHYKWIVWKLASYERSYSAKFMKKFLTISNVIDELKYRYEREFNHGQRSAIKRILEGDASPSSMLVLCVSAICFASEAETISAVGTEKGSIARVQLTDGWYSLDAQLDVLLSKHLAVGKLFVGQKLRICGASLNGWNGPVSPLEASPTVNLLLHLNGTYRVGWAERLGFCSVAFPPLAFRCVKSNGGSVPRTLVGVTRVYPILYRERLRSGRFIVRSEKMEAAITQLYNQRRSNIIEGIVSDFQRGGNGSYIADDNDDEGAQILTMLESAAEPEFLMAEMSVEQLTCLSKYQAKLEARRQSEMQRVIEKALEDTGVHTRDVTPFMRVRVVGLESKGQTGGKDPREGLIRIWNPTERQKLELAEGQAYNISGLMPLHSDSNTLHLEARGSSEWQLLTKKQKESFEPFFNPRKAVLLSRIGEVPLSSEFDTVGLVVHVGLEYIAGHQKKQWAFVTDGSLCQSQTKVSTVSMIAICFNSPSAEDDSMSPFNYNLVGSIVGFCNLVKRERDDVNHIWVVDATENATYYLNYDHPFSSHLKDAFASVKRWQLNSSSIIKKLREKVLCIVGSS